MKLYLLRHGEAENNASSDFNRQLTEQGRNNVVNVAKQLAEKKPLIDCCFVSPYLRAQQTAELFVPLVCKDSKLETKEILVPETPAINTIRFLEKLDAESVLLISHNPLLTELLALLSKGHLEDLYIVNTGELICLAMDVSGLGMATVEYTLS